MVEECSMASEDFGMEYCRLCPRRCGVARSAYAGNGFCRMGSLPMVARAALHFGEEPCISGERGSGTVFFCGCPLHCVFCQNGQISGEQPQVGKVISVERLREIFMELKAAGAHNINLVTPTHFSAAIAQALEQPVGLPVVYNCSGYERIEVLRQLEGKVQIYLPDFKYALTEPANRYSHAPDYPETAQAAILEMYRQVGPYRLDEAGMLQSGLLIRHLVLPGNLENTYRVIDWVARQFAPGEILFSLMSQYTPCVATPFEELQRTLSVQEYEKVSQYLFDSGIEDGFVQELDSATQEFIPDFDLTGI